MKIIFYGPIGGKSEKIIGGGESGNRKTISILKKNGFSVDVIEKPYPKKIPVIRGLIYPFQLLNTYFLFVLKLLVSPKPTFHLSGFYGHLIYIEYLFITTAKLLNIRSTYEIRAGGAIEIYNEGPLLYKFFFRKVLQNVNFVLCQGADYLPFIKKIANVEGLYYPNFVLDELLSSHNNTSLRDSSETIEIVYFGRIVKSKNIEFILEICSYLKDKKFKCEIIGGGDNDYINSLIQLSKDYGIYDKLIITPPINAIELNTKLKNKHFFLFPSKEKREGHSNSLTEAMSVGVVPIVSTAGFNASIVNQPNLVIEDFNPELYAKCVKSIWDSKKWKFYSSECYSRVKSSFSENAVNNTLKSIYSR
ncbi:glycosyltransferase family 4 protein [Emticicia oligotrophica]|uniref:glycosyltransferase family 4 protein n=1 Tax=Emticicia oligotrophica TaxID=312279 RepID=UPI00273AECEB|nr:glycosyltransferase family 4 protein [Emticicia oligotrophica]